MKPNAEIQRTPRDAEKSSYGSYSSHSSHSHTSLRVLCVSAFPWKLRQ